MSNIRCFKQRILKVPFEINQATMLNCLDLLRGGKMKQKTHSCVKFLNDKLEILGRLFGRQCNAIAAQRIRRANQMMILYNELYGEKTYKIFRKFGDIFKRYRKSPGSLMLGAVLFSWDDERVTDDDLHGYEDDIQQFWDKHDGSYDSIIKDHEGLNWEKVVDHDNFKLWRCPVPNSNLYQYRAFGSYTDIPARAFYDVQVDIEYRKQWDSHVIKIEKVDQDDDTGSEVLYWATHFPLGFIYSRDYVYVRRFKIDYENNMMISTAKSVDHPDYPPTSDYVRVGKYQSRMVIKPHRSFDEKGFDYVMSYFDDPQLYVPYWAVNRMTVSSLPSFVETLHQAAKNLHNSRYRAGSQTLDNQGTIQGRLLEATQQYSFVNYENQQKRQEV